MAYKRSKELQEKMDNYKEKHISSNENIAKELKEKGFTIFSPAITSAKKNVNILYVSTDDAKQVKKYLESEKHIKDVKVHQKASPNSNICEISYPFSNEHLSEDLLTKDFLNTIPASDELIKTETDESDVRRGLSFVISDLIQNQWDTIDKYNSAIATFDSEEQEKYLPFFNEIVANQTSIVGQLEGLLFQLNPITEEPLQDGQEAIDKKFV